MQGSAVIEHTACDYRRGCRCTRCRERHNAYQRKYQVAAAKRARAELRDLRQFKAAVLSLLTAEDVAAMFPSLAAEPKADT